MALDFRLTQVVAQSILTDLEGQLDGGCPGPAVIKIYEDGGSIPTNADDGLGGATLLAELATNACGVFTSKTDGNPGAVGTFDTISDDSNANATGTASFFRIDDDSSGTTICQGTVGTTSSFDLNLNTDSITSGSTVSITSATITVPEGP